mgnify:CR=1 FL=1
MNNEKDETIYNVPLWEKVMLTLMKPQLIQVLEAEKSDSLPIMKDVRSFYGMAQSDLSREKNLLNL